MDIHFTSESYTRCDSNSNRNEIIDDDPHPPPGLRRLVTGQTSSLNDGLSQSPFDRFIPGEGRDYSAPYQVPPPSPKVNNTNGSNFLSNNNVHNSCHNFFDTFVSSSSINDGESKVSHTMKNKCNNPFFHNQDIEKRNNFSLPANMYDNINHENSVFLNNFRNSSVGQPLTKPLLISTKNMQFDDDFQQYVPFNKQNNVSQFQKDLSPQYDDEQLPENEKNVEFLQQNNFVTDSEHNIQNEIINHIPSNRMAVEGSPDNDFHLKRNSSTPIHLASCDYLYSNNESSRLCNSSQMKDQNIFYKNKTHNFENIQTVPKNMQCFRFDDTHDPQNVINLYSKTLSMSSNSNANEISDYQHKNYNSEQMRVDHFNYTEILDCSDVPYNNETNNISKIVMEKSINNRGSCKNENELSMDMKQFQKINYENGVSDKNMAQHIDYDNRSISPKMVLGYNNCTLSNTEKKYLDEDDKKLMQHINNGNSVISQRIVLGNNDSNVPNIRKNVENLIRSENDKEVTQDSDNCNDVISERMVLGNKDSNASNIRKNLENLTENENNKQEVQDIDNGSGVLSQRMVLGNNDSNVLNIRRNIKNIIEDKSDKEVAQHIDGGNRLVSQRVVLGNNNVSVKKKNVENLIENEENKKILPYFEPDERLFNQRMTVCNNNILGRNTTKENVIQNDDDSKIIQPADNEKLGNQRMFLGNGNTIPRSKKNIDHDSKLNNYYSFDSSYDKDKVNLPFEQRMVVGETSNDTLIAQPISRIRDDRYYDDDKSRFRTSRHMDVDRNKAELTYNRRPNNCRIVSDEDDESLEENYDYSPDREYRSYPNKRHENSSHRYKEHFSRRHPKKSFTQSQNDLYDDYDDVHYNYENHQKFYERRPRKEQNYRSYNHDSYVFDKRKYQKPDNYRKYEENSFCEDRNSRPSSRSGSEYRSVENPQQRYYHKLRIYEHLDHRRIPSYDGISELSKKESEKWSKIRETDPKTYMNWFKVKYPVEYANWYIFFYSKMALHNSYQDDNCESEHLGYHSVNNSLLKINEEKLSRMNEQLVITQEIRNSPQKFMVPHVKGVFGPHGQLIVINVYSAKNESYKKVDVYQLLPPDKDLDWIEFMKFTGPFILGETHVNTVSNFLRSYASISSTTSEKLLYLLIDLIIKLRGVIDGIAISELLMSDYRLNHNYNDEPIKQSDNSSNFSETEAIEKYTNLLLQGNKNSALDFAVKHKLWGHAFLLASKMGTKYYNNILAKFDISISENNPLKTLYQLYSNQIPFAMTACSDEKWGDWRPHLAMILSNPSHSELDKTAIITLGDSLACKDVFASHFCYLVAEMEFNLPHKSPKFSLISLHNNVDSFGKNISNHAILLTQIYEFAKRLQRTDYIIPSLLPYKYLLATRLIDYGKCNIALQYLESITLDLMKNSNDQNFNLMYNVLELSERIKYSDLKSLLADVTTEKQWLTDLRDFVNTHFNTSAHVSRNERYSDTALELSDQTYQSHNFQKNELIQPLPSNFSQQQTEFSSNNNIQQSVTFLTTTSNHQAASLPPLLQNQSWENNSYSQSSMNTIPTEGYLVSNHQQMKVNDPSLNTYDNMTPSTNDQNQLYSSDDSYYPLDKLQQSISVSMHSRNNYFEDNSNKFVGNESETPNQKFPSQPFEKVNNKEIQESVKVNKSDNVNTSNPSWLGGLFSKLSIRPKNQAILPDDKNPELVWDKEKNCWIDKAKKEESDLNAIKPPPKVAELKAQRSSTDEQYRRHDEASQAANTPFINLNEPPQFRTNNIYNYSRKKGMKSNYVNVLSNNTFSNAVSNMPPLNTLVVTPNAQIPANVNLFIPAQLDNNLASLGDKAINSKSSQSRNTSQEMTNVF